MRGHNKIKRIILVIVTLALMCTLSACGGESAVATNLSTPTQFPAEDGHGDVFSHDSNQSGFTLIADFSNGMTNPNHKIKEIPFPSKNEMPPSNALVAFYLADELSEWTGLNFALNDVRFDGDSATVDWSADSTLISGLGNQTQKEGFHFFDAVSLNWFMMDSLAQTLRQNLDITTIYYN